jgi:hypothetical protein
LNFEIAKVEELHSLILSSLLGLQNHSKQNSRWSFRSQTGPITFSNAVEKFADIPQTAWERAQKVLLTNSTPIIGIDVYTGPNTKLRYPGGENQIRDIILKTAKSFDGFAQVPHISIVSYNAVDEVWAEQKQKEIAAQRGYTNIEGFISATKGNCQQSTALGQFEWTRHVLWRFKCWYSSRFKRSTY